ncbi:MAG TPA: hypothetical protein VFI73_13630 [Candidatus Nitrosopolaris sp.]|nr:hypothetical protein [Candidatus Nitrosopolaris sp.]
MDTDKDNISPGNGSSLATTSRSFRSLEDFISNLHKSGAALTDFRNTKIPTIYIDARRYDEIIKRISGQKLAVDTLLNIFHDGLHVFVDVQMKFLNTDLQENYLLYANDMIEFFESLSETGLISLAPDSASISNSCNVFMIQLPKKELAEKALQIIRSNANSKGGLILPKDKR